jgi:outer membrane protein
MTARAFHTSRLRLASVAWVILMSSGVPSAGAQALLTNAGEALPLTRDDVAYLALMNSRDLKVERFNSRIVEQDVRSERAAFHPAVSMEGSRSQSISLSGSGLAGSPTPEVDTTAWSTGIRARLISGAVASLDFVNSKLESNSQFLTLNPQYQSSLALTLTQPLLKGFGPDANLWRIKVAENNVGISRYQLRTRVAGILAETESTYWDLAKAFKDIEIRERALELTRDLAKRTEELVTEGFMPETARLQAKTSVLQREGDLLVARNTQRDAMRRLRDLLNFAVGGDPLIVPLDQPLAEPKTVDIAEAVKNALAQRPELPQARLDLRNKDLTVGFAKNQVLPQLNLFGSYGWTGLAGEAAPGQLTTTVTVPITSSVSVTRPITLSFPGASSVAVGGYGTSLDNLFSGEFPAWKVGMNLTFTLGNVAAKSQLETAELEKQRAEITVKNVENAIALEVERLGLQMQSTFSVIAVSRAFREQSKLRVDVTREKFQQGLASLSEVIEAQRDLVTAEQEEWKVIIDYNKILVQFDRATGTLLERYRVDL